MLSSGLASLIEEKNAAGDLSLEVAASGFRDVTRLADSPYSVWRDICLTNTENIQMALDALIQKLESLKVLSLTVSWNANFWPPTAFALSSRINRIGPRGVNHAEIRFGDPVPPLTKLKREISTFSRREMLVRPAPDKWSVQEVLAHLADVEEIGMRARVAAIVEQENPTLPYFDQEARAIEYEYNKADPRQTSQALSGSGEPISSGSANSGPLN